MWDERDPVSASSSRGQPSLWLLVLVVMRAHMPRAAGIALQVADTHSPPRPEGSNPEAASQAFGCSIFPTSVVSAVERASATLQQEEWQGVACPLLFIQLNQLLSTSAGLEWRETAR